MMAGCGSCSPGDSPTLSYFNDASTSFTIGDPDRTWNGAWVQPRFPAAPCTSPHTLTHTYFEVGVSTKYNAISSTTPVKLVTGSSTVTIGPFPNVNTLTFTFTAPGTYRLRVERPSCGSSFVSAYLEVTVLSAGGRPRFIKTEASIL